MDSMKPGGGGRFKAMEGKLSHRPGVTNPGALAAYIGRRKYGDKRMASMATKGRERHEKARMPADRSPMKERGTRLGEKPAEKRRRTAAEVVGMKAYQDDDT